MLLASYLFYSWWDWRFLGLIWLSTMVDYGTGIAIERAQQKQRKRIFLTLSICTNLGMLAVFKYADFFIVEFVNLLADLGVNVSARPLGIILPVGISFYTFQTMSYSLDIYRGVLKPTRDLRDFALFVAFFPQLVAGPIIRARDFLSQLATNDRAPLDVGRSMQLILGGLFKKLVLADVLASRLVDDVFANPQGATALETLLAIYGYALQIYGDFSGYSDIAIGIALLLGFQFPANFDQPYRAASLQEFWRRWHITLSSWLRDYLYIGMGGSHRGRARTYRNLLFTMFLGGLWHGAGWTFVVWGSIHGVGLVICHYLRGRRTDSQPTNRLLHTAKIVLTFHVICAGWVFFRSVDLVRSFEIFASLSGSWTSAPSLDAGLVALLLLGAFMQLVPKGYTDSGWTKLGGAPVVIQAIVVLLAVLGIDLLAPEGVQPFIYFSF